MQENPSLWQGTKNFTSNVAQSTKNNVVSGFNTVTNTTKNTTSNMYTGTKNLVTGNRDNQTDQYYQDVSETRNIQLNKPDVLNSNQYSYQNQQNTQLLSTDQNLHATPLQMDKTTFSQRELKISTSQVDKDLINSEIQKPPTERTIKFETDRNQVREIAINTVMKDRPDPALIEGKNFRTLFGNIQQSQQVQRPIAPQIQYTNVISSEDDFFDKKYTSLIHEKQQINRKLMSAQNQLETSTLGDNKNLLEQIEILKRQIQQKDLEINQMKNQRTEKEYVYIQSGNSNEYDQIKRENQLLKSDKYTIQQKEQNAMMLLDEKNKKIRELIIENDDLRKTLSRNSVQDNQFRMSYTPVQQIQTVQAPVNTQRLSYTLNEQPVTSYRKITTNVGQNEQVTYLNARPSMSERKITNVERNLTYPSEEQNTIQTQNVTKVYEQPQILPQKQIQRTYVREYQKIPADTTTFIQQSSQKQIYNDVPLIQQQQQVQMEQPKMSTYVKSYDYKSAQKPVITQNITQKVIEQRPERIQRISHPIQETRTIQQVYAEPSEIQNYSFKKQSNVVESQLGSQMEPNFQKVSQSGFIQGSIRRSGSTKRVKVDDYRNAESFRNYDILTSGYDNNQNRNFTSYERKL